MQTIIPHGIVKDMDILPLLMREGYDITHRGDAAIVSKEIEAPEGISRESVDDITDRVSGIYHRMGTFFEGIENIHVLVREDARGRMSGERPAGYVVEMSAEGPRVYALAHMDRLPMLAGYGSLMDPLQLAANTADGDLRNASDDDVRKQLAEEKDVLNKLAYVEVDGMYLAFNRAPTAKRHGATQAERNQWAVLNVVPEENERAYMVLFDPEQLTDDPLSYFARENFDEIEYARRRIDPKQVTHYGGAHIDADRGIWVLDSPLITDVVDGDDERLKLIETSEDSDIKDNYIEMVTNGLAGAEKVAPGFADRYIDSTVMPDGRNFINNHERFMETLERKLE